MSFKDYQKDRSDGRKSRGNFGGRSGGNFGGRKFDSRRSFDGGSGERKMFNSTCTKCGNVCKVPFKPTGGKPVLCSECFGKSSGGRENRFDSGRKFDSRRSFDGDSGAQKEQIDQINKKLDKILQILEDSEIESVE